MDPSAHSPAAVFAAELTGTRVGRFLVRERLGAGGMGEVYLAEDTTLKRRVAIKRLAPQLRTDARYRKRFFHEAERASGLDFQNIAAIYDVVEHNEEVFLVMEYIEGSTLRRHLQHPLSVAQFCKIALPCAQALVAAHAKGIVHCDIKPENIMLTASGRVKILDFGLAKQMPWGEGDAITASMESERHGVGGTSGYIAPEALLGKPVDGRADVFALGVISYEALTGKHPFRAGSFIATSDRILHAEPVPILAVTPELPSEIGRVVKGMLAKDPEQRLTAAQVAAELERISERLLTGEITLQKRPRWGRHRWPWIAAVLLLISGVIAVWLHAKHGAPAATAVAARAERVTVAVMPFEDLRGGPEADYFSDGMTEEMIMQLGRVQPAKLSVIARNSVMQYKHTQKPAETIGRELGAQYLLEGTVQRAGDEVRIGVELVTAKDKTSLWSQSYDGSMSNVLAIERKAAEHIAQSLAIELLPGTAPEAQVNAAAQEAYLKGRYYWNQRTATSLNTAARYFETAIQEAPNWPMGYVGLADCYNLMGYYGRLPLQDTLKKAKQAVSKALELDPNLAEAHASLSYALMYGDWNLTGAEKELKAATTLNPNYATAHLWYAGYLARTGHLDDAFQEMKRAERLDPVSPFIVSQVGFVAYYQRQFDVALLELQNALELDPDFWVTHMDLGLVYEQQGNTRESENEFQKALALSKGNAEVMAALGHLYGTIGDRPRAFQQIAALKRTAQEGYQSYYTAVVYAGLGDKDNAFAQLNQAYKDHEDILDIKVDPWFDHLRSDARYQALLHKVGL